MKLFTSSMGLVLIVQRAVLAGAPEGVVPGPATGHEQRVQAIIGEDRALGYEQRQAALKELRGALTEPECAALRSFLDLHEEKSPLPLDELNGLKNDVANRLRRQDAGSPELARLLIRMFKDDCHDSVWRDYCIQHLGGMWEALTDPGLGREVAEVIWSASRATGSPLAGTALIALFQNAGSAGFEKDRIADLALRMCGASGAGEAARMTAFQVCAELGERRALPLAREVVDAKAPVPLRMSAIAALGKLGDATDKARLEPYVNSADVRLRTSARAALQCLK